MPTRSAVLSQTALYYDCTVLYYTGAKRHSRFALAQSYFDACRNERTYGPAAVFKRQPLWWQNMRQDID